MASIVATGDASRERLKARGITPGKTTSRASYSSGGRVQKEVFFEGGEAVRTETYDYERGNIDVDEERQEYRDAAYYADKPYTKEQYDSAKQKVLNDLSESNRRIEEQKRASFEQHLRIMKTGVTNPTTATVISEASRQQMDQRKVYDPAYTEIVRDLNYSTLTGEKPGLKYYEQDTARKKFFISTNPGYFASDEEKKLFLTTDSNYEGKSFLEFVKGRRENVKEIKSTFTREELRAGKEEEFQLVKENVFDQLRQFKEAGVEYIRPKTDEEMMLISPGVPQAGLPTIYAPKDPKSFTDIVEEKDLPLAKGGAGMIAYTAASLPANAINPILTQTVDLSLAAPTYIKSFYNPTPRNRAERKLELIDIAVDFIPEAAGVVVGGAKGAGAGVKGIVAGAGAGFAVGRRIPTPNVNMNFDTNINTQFSGPEISPGQGVGSYGNAEVDISEQLFNDFSGGTTRLINTVGNFAAELPGININNQYQGEIGISDNILANENVNVNENVNINENVNENINQNINENINQNINENVNENVNENININENINANLAYNLNFNFNARGEKRKLYTPTVGSYQAFTKVQGIFTKIGPASSTPGQALKFGEQFVEGTAARTLGVTKSNGKIRGIDLGTNKLFKKKQSSIGTIYIEPLSRAINTPGEIAQISSKGKKIKKIKIKGVKI